MLNSFLWLFGMPTDNIVIEYRENLIDKEGIWLFFPRKQKILRNVNYAENIRAKKFTVVGGVARIIQYVCMRCHQMFQGFLVSNYFLEDKFFGIFPLIEAKNVFRLKAEATKSTKDKIIVLEPFLVNCGKYTERSKLNCTVISSCSRTQ